MALFEIELPNILESPKVIQDIALGNREYRFFFNWNSFANTCFLDLSLIDGNSVINIINGYALVINNNITKFVKNPNVWAGTLFLVDREQQSRDPEQSNFKSDFILVYDDGNNT